MKYPFIFFSNLGNMTNLGHLTSRTFFYNLYRYLVFKKFAVVNIFIYLPSFFNIVNLVRLFFAMWCWKTFGVASITLLPNYSLKPHRRTFLVTEGKKKNFIVACYKFCIVATAVDCYKLLEVCKNNKRGGEV